MAAAAAPEHYIVLMASYPSAITRDVHSNILQGYIPVGGIVPYVTTDGSKKVLQSMYRLPFTATAATAASVGGAGDPTNPAGGSRRTRKVRRA